MPVTLALPTFKVYLYKQNPMPHLSRLLDIIKKNHKPNLVDIMETYSKVRFCSLILQTNS
jgi:hypothetical protein